MKKFLSLAALAVIAFNLAACQGVVPVSQDARAIPSVCSTFGRTVHFEPITPDCDARPGETKIGSLFVRK